MTRSESEASGPGIKRMKLFHIADRATLYRRCIDALPPGAGMYIEDYFAPRPLSTAERHSLAAEVSCEHVPTLTDLESGLAAAGFGGLEFVDMSDRWTQFVVDRLASFRASRERNLALHGAEIVDGLDEFYAAVAALFRGGNLGGIRLVARKPSATA
jgi:hypothetical protein